MDAIRSSKQQLQQQPKTYPPDARLLKAMEFMRREFRRGPKLPEIARAAHLSPFHFHRTFRRSFGKTPKQVLAELQIGEAQRLMLSGVPLGECARRAGFAQQSHLTTRFKQATGLTPKAWLQLTKARSDGRTTGGNGGPPA